MFDLQTELHLRSTCRTESRQGQGIAVILATLAVWSLAVLLIVS